MMKPGVIAMVAALGVTAACEPTPPGVNTFITRESATVNYTTLDQPFTVRLKAGYGAPEFWCAAGRYAERRVSGQSRLYRLTPTPRPQGSNMDFTLVQPPAGVAQPTGLARFGDPNSLSVFEAVNLCSTVRFRLDGRF